jgi:hypothetical protein
VAWVWRRPCSAIAGSVVRSRTWRAKCRPILFGYSGEPPGRPYPGPLRDLCSGSRERSFDRGFRLSAPNKTAAQVGEKAGWLRAMESSRRSA